MNHKVLLADDSLTIQKVIKITLANEPYDLIDCNNDDELFAKLNSDKPSMVFLDFNLSEKKSGYELCRELKKKKSDLKVLMLFGTFDNIDESQLRDCGASGKVIKPFDSNKFINTCKMIIQELDEPAEVQEEKIETEELDNDDNWSVSSPEIEDKTEDEVSSEDTIPQEMVVVKNKLEEHVEDWSGGVETPKFQEMRAPKGDDGETLIMPEEDDLEYPEIDQGPKFIYMDELKTKDDQN